jgi:hypothetical protein
MFIDRVAATALFIGTPELASDKAHRRVALGTDQNTLEFL